MIGRCLNCDLPLATDDDTRRAMSDDERAGLCWSFGGRCALGREPVDWRARYMTLADRVVTVADKAFRTSKLRRERAVESAKGRSISPADRERIER